METKENEAAGDQDVVTVDEGLVLELNFVPQWARKPPTPERYESFGRDDDRRGSRRGGRYGGGDRDDRDRGRGADRGGHSAKTRRPRSEQGGQAPRERPRSFAPPPPRPESPGTPAAAVRSDRPRMSDRGYPQYPPVEHVPVIIRFFPDQKQLSAIVRQMSASRRAYPLFDVAALFFSKPDFSCVKLEPTPEAGDLQFYQCKLCRSVALDCETIESHILSDHLSEFFDKEEIEGEAPSGQFVCVARCGLSGILLGPPNHHSFGERVLEVHRTRFPSMDLDAYRARIETVREPELIEKWKEEVRRQTVYRVKNAPAGETPEPMKWQAAEAYLREQVVPQNVVRTRRAILSVKVASELSDQKMAGAIHDAWVRESRHPRTMVFALRAALRHKHLELFKIGKGIEYVTAVKPTPLDPEHTVEAISEVLSFLRDHPGCKRQALVEALRPGQAPGSPSVAEVLSPLSWLIEKGHIIEFFDGSLAVPLAGTLSSGGPGVP